MLQCPGVCRMNHRIVLGAKARHAEKEQPNEKSSGKIHSFFKCKKPDDLPRNTPSRSENTK